MNWEQKIEKLATDFLKEPNNKEYSKFISMIFVCNKMNRNMPDEFKRNSALECINNIRQNNTIRMAFTTLLNNFITILTQTEEESDKWINDEYDAVRAKLSDEISNLFDPILEISKWISENAESMDETQSSEEYRFLTLTKIVKNLSVRVELQLDLIKALGESSNTTTEIMINQQIAITELQQKVAELTLRTNHIGEPKNVGII